mmetsp:Transcript_54245/g.101683  ORF Transcript_54245/g.101683 Transcript_54245/m.101683 type:complete len:87 (-) Transcript_54245:10-270(-)
MISAKNVVRLSGLECESATSRRLVMLLSNQFLGMLTLLLFDQIVGILTLVLEFALGRNVLAMNEQSITLTAMNATIELTGKRWRKL